MRLIDADVICEKLAERAMEYLNVDECTVETIKEDMKIVNRIPTMEAEPVRHGYWEPVSDDDQDEGQFHCSICGAPEFFQSFVPLSKYCYNCGAKMDLEG